MTKKYEKALNTLIGYCKAKGKWQVGFEDPPYDILCQVAAQYYGESWSFEQFDNLLNYHLAKLKSSNLASISIIQIINDIGSELLGNMEDIFLVVPLKGACIKSSVSIGNISIIKTSDDYISTIPTSSSEVDIFREIALVTGIEERRISKAFSTIRHSRAKDFLSYPILIIKRHGQYDVIASIDYCHYILEYLNMFIRVLANHNDIKPSSKYLGWVKADHFFCIDEKSNYNHYPIRGSILVNYDLSFLNNPVNESIFLNIISLFESKGSNSLQRVYFRSMRFYHYGINENDFSLDSISQRLLNTLIAAETLMNFSTRGEKKSKLANMMIGLACVPEAKKKEFSRAVIEAYVDRSALVHSGNQELSKYIVDMRIGKRESESLNILTTLMSKILIDFPGWYAEIVKHELPDNYLSNWQQRIKVYVPIVRYSLFQKIVSKIIVFLQRIGRLHQD